MRKHIEMKIIVRITLILSSCFLLLLLYCTGNSSVSDLPISNCTNILTKYKKEIKPRGKEEFLFKTPGCSLPDYAKHLTFTNPKHLNGTCGPRAVFVEQVKNDNIIFKIDNKKIQKYLKKKQKVTCCYRFSSVSESSNISYTRCIPFHNGKKTKLLEEIVTVTCTIRIDKKSTDVVYEDSYITVKKLNKKKKKNTVVNSWNILVIGMSAMSRARINSTMPKTVQYLQTNKWLDYKGYHTVGYQMLSNVITLLTGKKTTIVNQNCMTDSGKCNEMFIWNHFRNAGYVTALADDYFEILDGFSKYKFRPTSTDHLIGPYFHVKYRQRKGNYVCTNKETSGKQLLDYAYRFIDTYKKINFFGTFWINTFSNRRETTPTLIDDDIVDFFKKINKTSLLKNTFVMFLSDHGMNSVDIKMQRESYYEKRLPMFFMWVPYEFQKRYIKEFNNIQINQNRLLSHYDVYATMMDILKIPNIIHNVSSEACPECTGLFKEVSPQRQCAGAGVDNEWCACHLLEDIDADDKKVSQSIQLVTNYIQNNSKVIKTIPCMTCAELKFTNILRTHTYRDNKNIYYVIAVQMSPGNISYEATVKENGNELSVVFPIESISRHEKGNCAINSNDRIFCLCDTASCNKDLVLSLYKK